VTEMFQSSSKVVFGDVNLSEESIRNGPDGGAMSPGAGGWPTVRYFNKETGYDGAPYDKKTDDAMCDELGNIDYMQAYVEEAGGASLCSIDEPEEGCSEKQVKYINKFAAKSSEDVQKQITRLNGMTEKKMKPELMKWVKQRLSILEQFAAKTPKSEL